jgi:hypothetical protein
MEQPTAYELAINLKTAKALDLTWRSTACTWRGETSAVSHSGSAGLNWSASLRTTHTLIFPSRRLAAKGLEAWEQGSGARLRGAGREGRVVAVPWRADALVNQGPPARLPRRGARLESGRGPLPEAAVNSTAVV